MLPCFEHLCFVCGLRRRALEVTNLTPPPVFIGLSPLFAAAQLLQAKLDLDVSKNRRDGVKGEARFIGINLKASSCCGAVPVD